MDGGVEIFIKVSEKHRDESAQPAVEVGKTAAIEPRRVERPLTG